THTAMVLFRGMADDLALMPWLQNYIFPMEGKFVDPEFIKVGMELAFAEMIRVGTTSFVDMYFYPDQGADVIESCGLRAILAAPSIDFPSPGFKGWDDSFAAALAFTNSRKSPSGRIIPAFAPHAPYTVSPEHIKQVADAARINHAPITIHLSEDRAEITQIKEVIANVFDSIGSGVITTNAQDAVTTFNRAASDILGRAPDTAIGQPLPTVLPKINADFDNDLREVRENNLSRALEAELDMPERGRVALSLKLSPLKDSNQQTQGVAIVVDDLTEQREREEKLNVLRKYLPPSLVDNIQLIAGLALGGERREMTCMFIDVRPLSTFPPELRPKQVMEFLNEYLEVATDAIRDMNGIIDKYMGTEIMALFSTQLNPQDDHALRAMEAALNMREGYLELYRRQGLNPQPHFYRVGIHSGVATTGNVGSLSRRDFTALGDTINLSHRLLENAAAGQIIISDSTRDYLQATGAPDNVSYEEREPIKAKGRQQATIVYEVFRA
ncbi:MAG: amidohydrolase family protein, partial [Anaerolineae bacterium]|nr:amidohydrolase family protein [Anaerolineae bacterium]